MKKINKNNNWFVFGEWFNINWFHSCYVLGLSAGLKNNLGYGLTQLVAEQDGNTQRIYFSKNEWENIGIKYLKEVLKNPKRLAEHLTLIKSATKNLFKLNKEFKKINFKNKTNEEIIRLLDKFHKKSHAVWEYGMIPNVIDLENPIFAEYLQKIIKLKGLKNKEVGKVFQVLVTPRELSVAQREERDILKLVKKGATKKEIFKHYSKYSYIHFGWVGPSLSIEYFEDVYKRLKKENDSTRLVRLIDSDKQLIKDKEYWIEKLNLSAQEVKLFRLMEELLYMKTYRMDVLFMSYEAIQPLLKVIAKKYYFSLDQVYAFYPEWLIEIMKNKGVDNYHNNLNSNSVRYYDGLKDYFLVGKEAKNILAFVKGSLPKIKKVNQLVGEIAFPGKVKGIVKVVNTASEMDKFREDDILVSAVTDPSLLSIMKKAKAFVTDTGGLTCHAAIVARELKKPCIVGTKIATKIFKDGDKVEVDANKGIVKKIK